MSGAIDVSAAELAALKRVRRMSKAERDALNQLLTPRMCEEYMPHLPHPPQQIFMGLNNKEVMFGGAAGGGKSDALLMAALQYVDVQGYAALILRRTYADLVLPGAIMDRAAKWWGTNPRVKKVDGGKEWRFGNNGGRIVFGYLQNSQDKFRYQSAEFQFIGFDELTQFQDEDYTYLFSRLRKPSIKCLICSRKIKMQASGKWVHRSDPKDRHEQCDVAIPPRATLEEFVPAKDGVRLMDVPLRMRGASNPGGIGHIWVRDRFVKPATRYPGSIFVPSMLKDNPSLDEQEYAESLSHLGTIARERLLNGDWDVLEEGNMFQRHWWGSCTLASVPEPDGRQVRAARFWDLAASEDGDFAASCRMVESEGVYYITDVFQKQMTPLEVERAVRRTAMQDGTSTRIYIEQEPGSSGKILIDNYRRNILSGFWTRPVVSSKSKEIRATGLSSAAEGGYVKLVQGEWNSPFMDQTTLFPGGEHDDMVDAASGAFGQLARSKGSRIIA